MATKEGDEVIEHLRGVMAFVMVTDRGLETMGAELIRLRDQLRDCETSLNIFDEGRVSEYWMRHADQPSNE